MVKVLNGHEDMNPSSLLLARTPPVASTSTYSTHIPSDRPSEHVFNSHHLIIDPHSNPDSESHHPSHSLNLSNLEPSTIPISNLHPTFQYHHQQSSSCPPSVEIIVESTTFLVHKEIIAFASPFFESILSGEWAETGLHQPTINHSTPFNPSSSTNPLDSKPLSLPPSDSSHSRQSTGYTSNLQLSNSQPSQDLNPSTSHHLSNQISHSIPLILPSNPQTTTTDSLLRPISHSDQKPTSDLIQDTVNDHPDHLSSGSQDSLPHHHLNTTSTLIKPTCLQPPPTYLNRKIDARIHLEEEKAAPFQDLLMFVYPHLEVSDSSPFSL